jgi:hypothetical protein
MTDEQAIVDMADEPVEEVTLQEVNNYLILLAGKSISGKTTSLRNLRDQPGVVYMNCESGKELPFRNKFKRVTITHPDQVLAYFKQCETSPECHTIIIDSLTYLMDMYESKVVIPAEDGRAAWGGYAQFFKELMQDHIAPSRLNVILTAHTADMLNEKEHAMETLVKVKGQLMNQGIESYFNNVIGCKKVSLDLLKPYENKYLNINEDDEIIGMKYVFQTRLTKATVNERIRGPLGMWKIKETYIDNDVQQLLDALHEYYDEE